MLRRDLALFVQPVLQCALVAVLEHHVDEAPVLGFLDVHELHDVRVVQLPLDARLLEDLTLGDVDLRHAVHVQSFDGYFLPGPHVAP